ncbi:MAG: hypothetical protein ACNI27_04765 [Desulfovibrio sp.]
MVAELISNAMHSTPQGFVGVSLIFIYLVWMVTMAVRRMKEAREHDHH